MNKTEQVFHVLVSKPDDLLSYKDMMVLTGFDYKQITRVIQTLVARKLIFKYVNPYSGLGRGRGKVAYYGVSEEIHANKKKTSKRI